jgi:hypothetical protein
MPADYCGRIVSFSIVFGAGGFMVVIGDWIENMLVEGLREELFSAFGGDSDNCLVRVKNFKELTFLLSLLKNSFHSR